MIRAFLILLLVGSSMACSTATVRAPLDFKEVKNLAYGHASVEDAKRSFGEPDQIVQTDSETIIWSYFEKVQGEESPLPRLNLVVIPGSNRIATALWMPWEGETLDNPQRVLDEFRGIKFKREFEGQVAKDYYSRDEIYSDDKSGISFYVNSHHKTVQSIGFGVPSQPGRRLGTSKN